MFEVGDYNAQDMSGNFPLSSNSSGFATCSSSKRRAEAVSLQSLTIIQKHLQHTQNGQNILK